MSQYQYYEFQAIDRPLNEDEMRELRKYSTRAAITPTRFVNSYQWGDFKGSRTLWMEKYFDAFLYLANWGTHELMFRLPRGIFDLDSGKRYCVGETACVRAKGDCIVLEFRSEEEGGDGWDDDGSGLLSSLLPLRAELAAGDERMLYLAWLKCAQDGELEEQLAEPPVPPGLRTLSAPLLAFAEFMRIEDDLIATAAELSLEADDSAEDLASWITALPEAEKTDALVRLATGSGQHLRAELVSRFRKARRGANTVQRTKPRSVSEILAAAKRRSEARRRREAEQAARKRAARKREAAEARDRYLTELAKREPELWSEVDALIASKPARYDEAVKLLADLREIGARAGRGAEVHARLLKLRAEHARKPSFILRLRKAGLGEIAP